MIRRNYSSLMFLIMAFSAGCSLSTKRIIPTLVLYETKTSASIPPTSNPPTDTPIPTFSSTFTSTFTPTPDWIFHSGTITCPILLYHRIADPPPGNNPGNRYYTSPADFKWQMDALKKWGYSSIPMSLMVEAIIKGTLLPPRPIVISFDDGDESVFENAFPIMKTIGYTGIMYLVVDYIGAKGYMNNDQIQEMTNNGWEIGSHSMTHPHLPAVPDQITFEGGASKHRLEIMLGVKVDTFAYPYGEMDQFIAEKIAKYGYKAAVGLGTSFINGMNNRYYLNRIEIQNGIDVTFFKTLLPWTDPQ